MDKVNSSSEVVTILSSDSVDPSHVSSSNVSHFSRHIFRCAVNEFLTFRYFTYTTG